MRSTAPLLAAALLVVTPACQMNERVTGTIIGAGGGLVVGGLLGSAVGATAAGMVLGAAAGGAAGYIWGDWKADQRERQCGSPCAPAPSPCAAPGYAYEDAGPSPCGVPPYADEGVPAAPSVAGARGSVADPKGGAAAAYETGRRATSPAAAIAAYDSAIRLDPARPEPHNAKGLVLLFQGRKAEARRAFEGALAADPGYAPARENLKKLAGA
jgi:hypothetical protein